LTIAKRYRHDLDHPTGRYARPLKRDARRQLPDVKHSHVLEALAAALGFKSWAALGTHLDEDPTLQVPFVSRCFVPVSRANLRERLVELGYPQATEWPLSFADLENGKDVVSDAETPGWDPSRDPVVLLRYFKSLALDVDQLTLGLLINMSAARDPRSDGDSRIASTMPLNWQPEGCEAMSEEDREDAVEDMIDEVVRPTLHSLVAATAQFRDKTKDGAENVLHETRNPRDLRQGRRSDISVRPMAS